MNRSNETMLELYRLMVVTREIDVAVAEIDGHWHGCDGEEAEVAAAYHGLKEGDLVAPHYRGSLSAAYARGADLRRLFAGIMGKATSYNRGRYRSDVCGPPEFNIIGLYSGALGLPLSYATGAALAFKLDGTDNVAVAVFGDGTSSRGDCHEAMNMASALKLPVVFVCQNNQVAISTPSGDTVAGNSVADRALGYGMPGARVDGNDVIAMHDAMEAAKARARRGEGPSLIEGLTYRAAGHFVSDAADPRPRNEVEAWRGRNPIRLVRERLGADGVADAARLDAIDAEVTAEVTAAMEQARNDPNPDAEVVDLRTIVPMDSETVLASVAKTGRLVIACEAAKTGGSASEVAAVVVEQAFDRLKAPILRVAPPNVPVPFHRDLEKLYLPDAGDIAAAARQVAA